MSKPLIIPWLRDQINSGRYPGLNWTDQGQTEFCIPWKHALRQDSSTDDSLIFKAWAEVSGKVQGDASVWKRNFRSALRAKNFKMVADNKNDTADPHKVFRWPEETATGRAGSRKSEPDLYQDMLPVQAVSQPDPYQDMLSVQAVSQPDTYQDMLPVQAVSQPDLYQDMLPVQSPAGGGFNPDLYFATDHLAFAGPIVPDGNQDILEQCLNGLNILEPKEVCERANDQHTRPLPAVLEEHVLPGQRQYLQLEGAVGGVELPGQPAYPMDVGVAREQQAVLMDTMSRTVQEDVLNTHFRLTVYYRGVKVLEQLLENEAGFRLVYRPDAPGPALDPQSGLSLVSLPRPGGMADQQQVRLTQQILDGLGDGLEVGVLPGNLVYGWRRGNTNAFWSRCKFDKRPTPQVVEKNQPQTLFLTRDFIRGLVEFIRSDGESPPFSLFFCLGEKWPDPNGKPWEKKLVMVEVVLTSLEMLKMMAVAGGASSLQSVELQMSLEESLQELMDLF